MSTSPLYLPPPPITPIHTHHSGDLFLNSSTCVSFLSSSANNRDQKLAACIHAGIWKSGLNANLYVNNSLLHAYATCGHLEDATKVFDGMPERDVVSWTALLSGHCHNGAADAALSVFNDMLSEETAPPPNEFTLAALLQACAAKRDEKIAQMVHGLVIANGFFENPFVHNCLVDVYSKVESMISVEKLIGKLSCADVVSWTSAISGCVLHGFFEKALEFFIQMLEEGIFPNGVTMLSIIHACSLMNAQKLFGWVHSWVVKLDLQSDSFVVNSLMEMYSRNGVLNEALKIFCHFGTADGNRCLTPDVMAALIQCCTLSFSVDLGEGIHGYLIKYGFFPCTLVENSLLDLYAKTEQVDSAHWLFRTMEVQDMVSWNTMISCYVKNSQSSKALQLLTLIHSKSGGVLVPDLFTLLSSIQACSELAALQQGQVIHACVIKGGFECDVFIGNALIDMYAKSGTIGFAERVFDDMSFKDLGSWNSMIAAYGNHGDANSALRVFAQLKECGAYQPSPITFLNVISACGHSGLISKGYKCFESMGRDYGIKPTMEHYACMVDLLGRSGKLNEAMDFINEMPVSPGADVWGSLLGACGLHGNIEIAERAAERLSVLKPDCEVWRVALSNVYSLAGKWELSAKARAEAEAGRRPRKDAGWSSVELRGGESFRFMVADTRHPKSAEIFQVLNGIKEQIKDLSTSNIFAF